MKWLDKLERKFGHLAIKGLMIYIIGLTAFVFFLGMIDRGIEVKLMLIPQLVMRGEVWRLFTYLFIPPTYSVFWILFTLYFYHMIGSALENEWGSFRFNIYYLIGMIGTTAAAFFTGIGTTGLYLNLSLFLAFARIYPDYQILLFFFFPVKVKYLAWLQWAFIAITVLTVRDPGQKVAALVSIINYFVFFGKDIVTGAKASRQAYYNRSRYQAELPKDFTIHKCTICGATEKSHPDKDFRYCMTCEGDYEYCMDHLKNHEHIKGAPENLES